MPITFASRTDAVANLAALLDRYEAALAPEDQGKLILAAEMDALVALVERENALLPQLDGIGIDAPHLQLKAARDAYAAAPTQENLDAITLLETNKEAAHEHFGKLRSMVKAQLREVQKDAAPTVRGIMARIVERATAILAEAYTEEAALQEAFGVPSDKPGMISGAIENTIRHLEGNPVFETRGLAALPPFLRAQVNAEVAARAAE